MGGLYCGVEEAMRLEFWRTSGLVVPTLRTLKCRSGQLLYRVGWGEKPIGDAPYMHFESPQIYRGDSKSITCQSNLSARNATVFGKTHDSCLCRAASRATL